MERVWPYVLPFPLEAEKRKLIWSILQSRVGINILTRVRVEGRTYQQELMRGTPYSNKSVIQYLKKMVSAGMLEQGMERATTKKKRGVWVKWYTSTQLGKWFILFLRHPREIPPDLARKTIEELFQVYSSSIVEVCERYGLSVESFHRILNEQHLQEIVKEAPKTRPEVAVYGSAALDIYASLERMPRPEESTYVAETGRYLGGMGANVAVALARLGASVAFIGKIGSDLSGRLLLESFRENNVDISNVIITKSSSLQTLILTDREGKRWLLTLGSPDAALSLTSPNEIDWNVIRESEIIYIGEVFIEVAPLVASFARDQGKRVVYRPGLPYLRFGIEKIRHVLEHADIFILNQKGWATLQEASKEKMENPADLLKNGLSTVIVTKGLEGCEVHTSEERFAMPVPTSLKAQFKVVDPTGAGDSFSAGLIKGFMKGWSLRKAILYGQTAASITCSRLGTTSAFPKVDEVERAFENTK